MLVPLISCNMLESKPDPNLWDMDAASFLKVQDALDENCAWKRLLSVMPSIYSENMLQLIHVEGYKYDSSPAKVMLYRLGDKGVRVSLLIKWLEAVGLEKILLLIKDDEPLKIIEHPSQALNIIEDSTLRLTCRATSFPSPIYQWFKGEEELLLHQDPDLIIPHAKVEDSGIYVCRVHTVSSKTGNVSWDFSNSAHITVVPKCHLIGEMEKKCTIDSTQNSNRSEDTSEEENCLVDRELKWKSRPKPEQSSIEIIRYPVSPGKIARGSSITLSCEARCDIPVRYQWFCDGREIPGATSSHLRLENIFPDPHSGATKWDYLCRVSHDFCEVLTRSVCVELLPSDENTQYFADEKIALLMANDAYENLEHLISPANDVVTLGKILSEMGFKIFAFHNLTLKQMKNVFGIFCKILRPNVYGLVYFAGHGFELCKQVYLQPVDCSMEPDPEESLCVDYILECMQKKEPTLNVLLIDACRDVPLKDGHVVPPGKFYKAETHGNTVFGYATSSLCSSHECDSEPNSFFVKYLKNYLPKKIKVQDVLFKVQHEFQTDPLARNIQYPFVGSSLFEFRSLRDEVRRPEESIFDSMLPWANITSPVFEDRYYCIKQLDVTIVLEFHHHKGVFLNAMDVKVYLDIGKNALLSLIRQVEFLLQFPSENIQKGMKQLVCRPQNEVSSRCLQTIFEISGLQNIKESLNGVLIMKHGPTGKIMLQESFSLGTHHVLHLNLNKKPCEPNLDSSNKLNLKS